MAAALLKAAFPARRINSAGIGARIGEPADPLACTLMREKGLDLDSHRARSLDETLLREHDLVLVMEQRHREWIEERWPFAAGRVYRWGHWPGFDVPDPYRKDEAAFRESFALIERGLVEWKERL